MKIKGCKKRSFIDQAIKNGGQPIFYVLKCWNEEEQFYKIGISTNHILTRYATPRAMPYEFEILLEQPDTAEAVYDFEVKLKGQLESFQYAPSTPFNGSKTECYTDLTEQLHNLIFEVDNQRPNCMNNN